MDERDRCRGCRDDWYNQNRDGCWMLPKAKVVTRYRIGTWTQPTQPGAFTKVKVLDCYHQPGQYAYSKGVPDFAIDVQEAPDAE